MALLSEQCQSSKQWQSCYLGLGSNLHNELGTPVEHIDLAIQKLASEFSIQALQKSSLYQSAPLGPQDQPDFINAVVGFKTTLEPLALLDLCQKLEQEAKRERLRHWGERSLDVDILLYADKVISHPRLTVPHLEMTKRNFVLLPLLELNPDLMIDGKCISDYPASQDWTGLTVLS